MLLPALKPACSSAMIFSACGSSLSSTIFSMTLLERLMRLYRSVVLAVLQDAFLGKCDGQGLGPQCWPFSCLSDLTADCRQNGDYVLSACLDQFCWDVVNSSWFPFLQWLYCSLHFFAKDGVVVLCVCLGIVRYWWISIGFVIVQLIANVRNFPERSWIVVVFSCFTVVISFTSRYALWQSFFLRFPSVSLHCSLI